jgi:hypothetical protein
MIRFGILDDLVFLVGTSYFLLLAETFVTLISCIVTSLVEPPVGPDHPGWKYIGGGAYGWYHPT